MEKNSFAHYTDAGTNAIEADADGRGTASAIFLVRVVINGGTAGAITLAQSASALYTDSEDTEIGIVTPQAGGGTAIPVVIEYGVHVADTLIVKLAANTDVTVVYRRMP
jgi:hypothetical protein